MWLIVLWFVFKTKTSLAITKYLIVLNKLVSIIQIQTNIIRPLVPKIKMKNPSL